MARGPATSTATRPRMGRPTKADTLAMELDARKREEREWAARVVPIVTHARRSHDPRVMAAALVAAEAALVRHARRWAPGGDAA